MYSNPYFTYMYYICVGIVGGSPQKIYPQESLFVAQNTIIIRILVYLCIPPGFMYEFDMYF